MRILRPFSTAWLGMHEQPWVTGSLGSGLLGLLVAVASFGTLHLTVHSVPHCRDEHCPFTFKVVSRHPTGHRQPNIYFTVSAALPFFPFCSLKKNDPSQIWVPVYSYDGCLKLNSRLVTTRYGRLQWQQESPPCQLPACNVGLILLMWHRRICH